MVSFLFGSSLWLDHLTHFCMNVVLPLAINLQQSFRYVKTLLYAARLARYRKRYAAFHDRRSESSLVSGKAKNIDARRQNPRFAKSSPWYFTYNSDFFIFFLYSSRNDGFGRHKASSHLLFYW